MALSYLGKQLQHAHACLTIGEHIDIVLIARSMLEGCSQLLWAEADAKQRADLWRRYPWVEEWRELQDRAKRGRSLDPARRDEVAGQPDEIGHLFYTARARKASGQGISLPPDPYSKKWHGQTETQLFEQVAAHTYLAAYRDFSEWQHWNPYGFKDAIVSAGQDQAAFAPHNPRAIAHAFACAFQSLLETARCVDRHIPLDLTAQLIAIRGECLASLEASEQPE